MGRSIFSALRVFLLQVYNNGLRHMNLQFILTHLCAPVIACLGVMLAVPYIIAKSFVPAFGKFTDSFMCARYRLPRGHVSCSIHNS